MICLKVFCLLFLMFINIVQGEESLEKCLEKDSISCVQMQMFKRAKSIIDLPSLEIFSGLKIQNKGRTGKSLDDQTFMDTLANSTDFDERQRLMEEYLTTSLKESLTERTIEWNPSETMDKILDDVPEETKSVMRSFAEEGRGKKKMLKMLLPLLLAFKLKFGGLIAVALLGIAAIAKKALIAGAVSLLLSAWVGISGLFAKKKVFHHYSEDHHGIDSVPQPFYAHPYGHEDLSAHGSQQQAYYADKKTR